MTKMKDGANIKEKHLKDELSNGEGEEPLNGEDVTNNTRSPSIDVNSSIKTSSYQSEIDINSASPEERAAIVRRLD